MKWSSLSIFMLLFSLSAFSQVSDAGLWTGVSVDKEIADDLKADLEMETRFYENISELESAFFDLSLEYKLTKFLDVSVDYRFGNKKELNDTYLLRQRVAGNIYLDADWRDLEFVYRLRLQRNLEGIRRDEAGIEFSSAVRHKFSVTLDLPDRYEIETEYEIFTGRTDQNRFDQTDWRVKAEIKKGITKDDNISLGYLIQRQVNENNPLMEFIFLISYSYELD
ncbi:DUF2490 domain-containing protein [Halocola ammonii]